MATQAVVSSVPNVISAGLQSDPVTVNVVKLVESARKAKSPITAIPIPGEVPLCLKTELLRESLRGMRITEASIQRVLGMNDKALPYLLVFGVTEGGVKGSRKYYPVNPSTKQYRDDRNSQQLAHKSIRELQTGWAEKVQDNGWATEQAEKKQAALRGEKPKRKAKGKADKITALIRKIEKERAAIHTKHVSCGNWPVHKAGDYERETWQSWRDGKAKRKALARIVGRFRANVINELGAYKELDILFGTKVRRISQLRTHDREKAETIRVKDADGLKMYGGRGDLLAYLCASELFPGTGSKPRFATCHDDAVKKAQEHQKYLKELAERRREAAALDAQLADLRAMLAAEGSLAKSTNSRSSESESTLPPKKPAGRETTPKLSAAEQLAAIARMRLEDFEQLWDAANVICDRHGIGIGEPALTARSFCRRTADGDNNVINFHDV